VVMSRQLRSLRGLPYGLAAPKVRPRVPARRCIPAGARSVDRGDFADGETSTTANNGLRGPACVRERPGTDLARRHRRLCSPRTDVVWHGCRPA
jgi:hypothetical protein